MDNIEYDSEMTFEEPPEGYFDSEVFDIAELSKYAMVIEDAEVEERAFNFLKAHTPKGVIIETRPLEFDKVPPSYGMEGVKIMESVIDYCEQFPGPNLHQRLARMRPQEVLADDKLKAASDRLLPLLDPKAWKAFSSDTAYRQAKTKIISPYLAVLNNYFRRKKTAVYRVLVLGSWSGADIQRIAVARGGTEGIVVDTYDPYAPDGKIWSEEFRAMMLEEYGTPVRGSHYTCSVKQMALEIPFVYDLVLAANCLHQWMRNMDEFRGLLGYISSHLSDGGAMIGITPTLEGFRALENSPDVGLLSYAGPKTENDCPFGSFRCLVGDRVMDDPVLPSDYAIVEFGRVGLFLELMPSSQVSVRFPMERHMSIGPESRGYLTMYVEKRPDALSIPLALTPIASEPRSYPHYHDRPYMMLPSFFTPRDVGHAITLEDSWFLQRAPFYMAHKTDGIGAILVVQASENMTSVVSLRIGSPNRHVIRHFKVPYEGPEIVLDGEFMERVDQAWEFDIYGLVRYNGVESFTWLPGMLIVHSWLEKTRNLGFLQNFGIKAWKKASPALVRSMWAEDSEGLVFKYPCAPSPVLHGTQEIGTAKYVKHVVTYDLRVCRVAGGGTLPPIAKLPDHLSEGTIVECTLDEVVGYIFFRVRLDRDKPNPQAVLDQKTQSSSIDDIVRWIGNCGDLDPLEVDLISSPEWQACLSNGVGSMDLRFRIWLVSTGIRRIYFHSFGTNSEHTPVYDARFELINQVLSGKFDEELFLHKSSLPPLEDYGSRVIRGAAEAYPSWL